jgi:saccharopine dehydrogenase-like NADP-dependent oxidoreductase
MIGSGGVGAAAAKIAAEREFFDRWVVADYDLQRAERAVREVSERHTSIRPERFCAAQVDASDADAVSALAREHGATHVLNAVDRGSSCRSSGARGLPGRTTSTWR